MGRQLQREDSTYALRPPKYGSERVIYLPDELVAILSEHVETHIGDADPEQWLFMVSNDPYVRHC